MFENNDLYPNLKNLDCHRKKKKSAKDVNATVMGKKLPSKT